MWAREGKSFGQAMLEKMGWQPGGAIGRKPLSVLSQPVEVVPQRSRHGVGVEQHQLSSKASTLLFSTCKVVDGEHKGMQGVITGQGDGLLEVEINSARVSLPQHFVQVSGQCIGRNPFAGLRRTRRPSAASKESFEYAVGMCVQIQSKGRDGGRLYLVEATIVYACDLHLVLRTADNRYIDDVSAEEVKPVAPTAGGTGIIGRGPHKGHRVVVQQKTDGGFWTVDAVSLESILVSADDIASV